MPELSCMMISIFLCTNGFTLELHPDKVLVQQGYLNHEEVSYDDLANVGLPLGFQDGSKVAKVDFLLGNIDTQLQLGKDLNPNYASQLFSHRAVPITDSSLKMKVF